MKLLLAGLVFGLLQGVFGQDKNPCEGILTGIVVHPDVCYKYIICFKEQPEVVLCPEGTIFSLDEIACVPGNQDTCVEGFPEEPEEDNPCRGIVLGQFPHPESCTQFFRCVLGRLQERTCPRGFIFSQRTWTCFPGNGETCEDFTLPSTPPPADLSPIPLEYCLARERPFGRLPHPQSCTHFVQCFFWVPEQRECPSWTVFHEGTSICLPGNPNTCQTVVGPGASPPAATPPITDDICPDQWIGLVAHPYSCYRFVTCLRGSATEQECPPYHVFSSKVKLCLPGNRTTCQVYGEQD